MGIFSARWEVGEEHDPGMLSTFKTENPRPSFWSRAHLDKQGYCDDDSVEPETFKTTTLALLLATTNSSDMIDDVDETIETVYDGTKEFRFGVSCNACLLPNAVRGK